MRDCTPTREEARALSANHRLIPVYREVLADMLTPVRAYTLLCPADQPGFLLESVEGGERLARYSSSAPSRRHWTPARAARSRPCSRSARRSRRLCPGCRG